MSAEAAADTPALTIAKFEKALHDRSAFSCGFAPIDNFLKSSLSDQIKAGMVAAWIATDGDDPAVLGFYTLGAMAVRAILVQKSGSALVYPISRSSTSVLSPYAKLRKAWVWEQLSSLMP